MPRPLRSSCDRCHSHKLKCPKQPGVPTCTRCLKAGATCTFSPAGVSTRRMTQATNLAYMNSDVDMSMQFDWPSLDLENVLVTPPEFPQDSLPDQQIEQAETVSHDPRSTCVRLLTSLAVDIDQVSISLSVVSHVHVPKDRPIEEYHDKFIENNGRSVLSVLFDRPDSPDCQDPDCFHESELPNDIAAFFSAQGDDKNEIDTFLFNLLVSCHGKVVDAMGTIINCAKTCTQVTLASPDLVEPHVHAPEVRVGNFVATHTSASTMQTVLLIHIASVLVGYAQQLTKKVATIVEAEQDSKQAQMLKLQCELLERKSVSKMRLLQQVKELLTTIDFKNYSRETPLTKG
ncbi:hypothetical protein F5Y11DRAFT_348817 [Daldinia sp. FL1419]|nr:hypothetical protein F5Y11DRAFT_348817 [Daldinia sp. FL1419]